MKNRWEWMIVIFVAMLLVIGNQWHVVSEWVRNPPGFYFTGIAHYYEDYFLYVTEIARGADGRFVSPYAFTDEIMTPTFLYKPYTLMGAIGKRFFLSPFASYNAFLALFCFSLIGLWYLLAQKLFSDSKKRIVFFLFVLFSSNYPDLVSFFHGTMSLVGDFWFSPTPSLNRLGGVPHQILQTIVLLLLPLFWTAKKRLPLILCFFTVFATILNPIQTGIMLSAIAISLVFPVFIKKTIRAVDLRGIRDIILLFFCYGVSAFFVQGLFSNIPIYELAKQWEFVRQVGLSGFQMATAFGPVLVFSFLGILPVFCTWKKQSQIRLIALIYSFLCIGSFFTPIPIWAGILNVRLLAPVMYMGIAFLATEGLFFLKEKTNTWISYGFFSLFLILSLLSLGIQVYGRTDRRTNPILASEFNHVPFEVTELLRFIQKQDGNDMPVVLTDPYLPFDVLIPSFTGKISFTGHLVHTLDLTQKNGLRTRFVKGGMDQKEVQVFLKDHRIRYLIIHPTHVAKVESYGYCQKLFANTRGSVFACSVP